MRTQHNAEKRNIGGPAVKFKAGWRKRRSCGVVIESSLAKKGCSNHKIFSSQTWRVDENLIFCKANMAESQAIHQLLKQYEEALDQQINRSKIMMNFSNNVRQEQKKQILNFMNATGPHQMEKYLGLPPFVGRDQRQTFSTIKQKVWQKLQEQKEKLLSQGGRDVLIKVVVLSIPPTYIISCFKLPKNLCEEHEQIMALFWWEQKRDEKKTYWISWKNMQNHKRKGYGIKIFEYF